RAAGLPLEIRQVQVESLVPPELDSLLVQRVAGALERLDAPLASRLDQARALGGCLRFVRSFDADGARASLQVLPPADRRAAGAGTDTRVASRCDRCRGQPLRLQGPGAGADITAAALLDDVLRIAA